MNNEIANDTWEWDGKRWNHLTSVGPLRRFATRMAYDDERKEIVLFGGRDESDFGDTWIFKNGTWTEMKIQGPPKRNVHEMVFDKSRKRIVLFGGVHSPDRFNDVLEWDGRQWKEIK